MKKQLLAGAFILASFFAAQAQELISTDFGTDQASYEATFPDDLSGWGNYAFDQDGDFFSPDLDSDEAVALGFSGVSMWSASFINQGTDDAPDLQITPTFNFIASPAVDLTDVENAYITLRVGAFGAEDAVMGYQILAITEDDWQAEEFGNMVVAGEGTIAAGQAENVNFTLDGIVGFDVRFLILHNSDANEGIGYFIIDDVAVVEGVAGLNDNTITNLSVFPNPVNNGLVNVTADALVNNITIVDLNGRTVKAVKFNGVAEAQVNVSDLASGVYMMTIASDKGTATKKIVKN